MSETSLYLITGGRNSGKTDFCATVAAAARAHGWNTTGVLTRITGANLDTAMLEIYDINSGESRVLAHRRQDEEIAVSGNSPWAIDRATLGWANQLYQAACPCDLLIVDEISTMEFEHGDGYSAALNAIENGLYHVALVVFRPDYLLEALTRWPEARLIEIETPDESNDKAQAFCEELFNYH